MAKSMSDYTSEDWKDAAVYILTQSYGPDRHVRTNLLLEAQVYATLATLPDPKESE